MYTLNDDLSFYSYVPAVIARYQTFELRNITLLNICQIDYSTPTRARDCSIHINFHLPSEEMATLKYSLNAWTAVRSMRPTKFHRLPQPIREPRPFLPFRSLAARTFNDLLHNDEFPRMVKRYSPAEDFIYHHPQCVTVREFRRAIVFGPELVWGEQFWTHPSDRAPRYKRGGGYRGECGV